MATANANKEREAAPRRLTVYDLHPDENGPIWVVNNTDGPRRGNVTFSVPHLSGLDVDTINIPPTWLAIDLMTKVGSRRQLLQSAQFKRALDPMATGGQALLRLITDDEARELLASPGAEEEMQLLRQRENAAYQIGGSRDVQIVHNHESQQPQAKPQAEQSGPSARVVQLIENLSSGQATEVSVINSLRGMGSNLKAADIRYILERADAKNGALLNYVRSRK